MFSISLQRTLLLPLPMRVAVQIACASAVNWNTSNNSHDKPRAVFYLLYLPTYSLHFWHLVYAPACQLAAVDFGHQQTCVQMSDRTAASRSGHHHLEKKKNREKNRKAFTIRRHNGSLGTQKQSIIITIDYCYWSCFNNFYGMLPMLLLSLHFSLFITDFQTSTGCHAGQDLKCVACVAVLYIDCSLMCCQAMLH